MDPNTPYHNDELRDIRRYVEEQMSAEERHNFESRMLEDPFLADAVDGFTENPDWAGVSELQTEFGGSGSTSYSWLYIALTTLVVVVAAWFLIPSPEAEEKQLSEEPTIELPVNADETELNIAQEQNDEESTPNEIVEVSKTDSSVSMILKSAPNTLPEAQEHYMATRTIEAPEKMQPISGIDSSLQFKAQQSNEPKLATHSTPGARIYHVRDYKVADYRGLRFALQRAPEPPAGTPASDGVMPREMLFPEERKIPYVDFIEEAMISFASEDHKSALEDFRLVLDKYPSDVNAQFYGGMSARKLGLYAMAIQLLSSAEENVINTFKDEARYYKALCLKETGKIAEFEAEMAAIANSDSFYRDQAKEWIK